MGNKNTPAEAQVSEIVVDAVPLTAHASDLVPDGYCVAVLVNVDCVLNVQMANGQDRSNVFFAKGWNPVAIKALRTGADASTTNVWGGYTY